MFYAEYYYLSHDFLNNLIYSYFILNCNNCTLLHLQLLILYFTVMLPTQAEAILSLTLRRLTALEATKLQSEHSELTHAIAGLDILMQNNTQVYDVIKSETLELRQKHAISRRSEIVTTVKATLNDIDLIANERYEIGRFSVLYL